MTKKNPHHSEWIELYNSGESTSDIAGKFDVSPRTVWQALSRIGIDMRRSKFSKFHEEWVTRYLDGESLAKIANDYGTDAANVHFTLRQKGVECRKTPETVKHEELLKYHIEWAELYRGGMSAYDIARKYSEDSTTVWRAVRANGVETRKPGETNRKYFVQNDHAFDVIDDAEKAYWLGFLMADGNVYSRSEGSQTLLQVNLSVRDKEHVEKLKVFLGTDAPIGNVEETKSINFHVGSNNLTNGLISHGCIPRKSLVIKYPELPDDLQWSFVLGYFDGNGSVFMSKKPKINALKYGVSVIISSGSIDFLLGLQAILLKHAGISSVALAVSKNSNSHQISIIRKADIRKLHKWFYSKATVFIDRKKIRFDELITNKGF